MPRTAITVTALNRTGVADPAEATADVTNGNSVVNDGRTFLRIRNAHATVAQTSTFITPGTVDNLAIADRTLSVPATQTRTIGPFPVTVYGSTLEIDSTTVDLKYIVFSLPLG